MSSLDKLKRGWNQFTRGSEDKHFRRRIRQAVVVIIVGIIVYQLFEIGWMEVLRSLPTQPLFYILFAVLFITLPVAEIFIYRTVWNFRAWEGFKAFLTKRVYNDEILGYSGELYLAVWGQKRMKGSGREILKHIRDNNILSAISSHLVAIALVGVLIFSGWIDAGEMFDNVNLFYFFAGIVLAAAVSLLVYRFRSWFFQLSLKKSIRIFSIYLTRFLIHHALLVVQWAVVIPNTPVSVWLTFLAVVIVVNRIPLIPSKDLLFVWAGIELSRVFEMTTAAVAGMLLVSSALNKLTNLLLFLWLTTSADQQEVGNIRQESLADSHLDGKDKEAAGRESSNS